MSAYANPFDEPNVGYAPPAQRPAAPSNVSPYSSPYVNPFDESEGAYVAPVPAPAPAQPQSSSRSWNPFRWGRGSQLRDVRSSSSDVQPQVVSVYQPPPQSQPQPALANPYLQQQPMQPIPNPYNQQPMQPIGENQPQQNQPALEPPPIDVDPNDPVQQRAGARFNFSASEYRDWPFLILFILHLCGFFIVAGIYGNKFINDVNYYHYSEWVGTTRILVLSVSGVIPFIFTFIWIYFLKKYTEIMIQISTGITFLVWIGFVVYCLATGQFGGAIGWAILIALNLRWYIWARKRIPFAAIIIRLGIRIVSTYKGAWYATIGLAILLVAWTVTWIFTVTAVMYAQYENNVDSISQTLTWVVLCSSLYWTNEVLRNTAHVTVAGVTAAYWMLPGEHASLTLPAFKRATTTSAGSICLSGLFATIIETIWDLLRQWCCCSHSMLSGCPIPGVIRWILSTFNKYTLSNVAIYGNSFMTAGEQTFQLFKAKFFELITNDSLAHACLFVGCIVSGLISGIFVSLWAGPAGYEYWLQLAILAFVFGFFYARLFFGVIDSAISTTYMCWAEAPERLLQCRPTEFTALMRACEPFYGWDERVPRQPVQQI